MYLNLREGILNTVISNSMAGSLWHFNRFLYTDVKILDSGTQIFW